MKTTLHPPVSTSSVWPWTHLIGLLPRYNLFPGLWSLNLFFRTGPSSSGSHLLCQPLWRRVSSVYSSELSGKGLSSGAECPSPFSSGEFLSALGPSVTSLRRPSLLPGLGLSSQWCPPPANLQHFVTPIIIVMCKHPLSASFVRTYAPCGRGLCLSPHCIARGCHGDLPPCVLNTCSANEWIKGHFSLEKRSTSFISIVRLFIVQMGNFSWICAVHTYSFFSEPPSLSFPLTFEITNVIKDQRPNVNLPSYLC